MAGPARMLPRDERASTPFRLVPVGHPVCDHARMDEQVIPILRVANAAAAVAWYERLGFTQEWEHRIEPDWPAFVSIARGRARLFLSEHRGDARPGTLVGLFVSDIAPVLAEFGPPAGEQPYRCEIELRDPDGNRLRISTARAG
jgi:catechol 2,3-dioxygenase-like lactoylglutathione lyase family enzyme